MAARMSQQRGVSRTCLATIFGVASIAIFTGFSSNAGSTATCNLYASTVGQDTNPGSQVAPFRSAQRLVNSLSAGMTGCLRAGTFSGDVKISKSGQAGSPITVRSFPGERASVVGRLWVASTADHVVISDLLLNGKNSAHLPSPTINAYDVTFSGNEVTNEHTGICFVVGSTYGRADRALISGNRIHDCGRLPSTNKDHGIYVGASTGSQIVGNQIYNNADRGIQLYPDAQRTLIRYNIIDRNGEGIIFSGDFGLTSSDNTVEYNTITNSKIRYNVESYYPAGNPIGRNNVVRYNCIGGGARAYQNGGIETPTVGFVTNTNQVLGRRSTARIRQGCTATARHRSPSG